MHAVFNGARYSVYAVSFLRYGANYFNDKVLQASVDANAGTGTDPCLLTNTPQASGAFNYTDETASGARGGSSYEGCATLTRQQLSIAPASMCYEAGGECGGFEESACRCTIMGAAQPVFPTSTEFIGMSNYYNVLRRNLNVPAEGGWPSAALANVAAFCGQDWAAAKTNFSKIPDEFLATTCQIGVQLVTMLGEDAYGLTNNSILLADEIQGVKVTWALGAMIARANIVPVALGEAERAAATTTKGCAGGFKMTLYLANFLGGTVLGTTAGMELCDSASTAPQVFGMQPCFGGVAKRAALIRAALAGPGAAIAVDVGASAYARGLPLASDPAMQELGDAAFAAAGFSAYALPGTAGAGGARPRPGAAATAAEHVGKLRGLNGSLPLAVATNLYYHPGEHNQTYGKHHQAYTLAKLPPDETSGETREVAIFSCIGVAGTVADEVLNDTHCGTCRSGGTRGGNMQDVGGGGGGTFPTISCKCAMRRGLSELARATSRHAHLPQVVLIISSHPDDAGRGGGTGAVGGGSGGACEDRAGDRAQETMPAGCSHGELVRELIRDIVELDVVVLNYPTAASSKRPAAPGGAACDPASQYVQVLGLRGSPSHTRECTRSNSVGDSVLVVPVGDNVIGSAVFKVPLEFEHHCIGGRSVASRDKPHVVRHAVEVLSGESGPNIGNWSANAAKLNLSSVVGYIKDAAILHAEGPTGTAACHRQSCGLGNMLADAVEHAVRATQATPQAELGDVVALVPAGILNGQVLRTPHGAGAGAAVPVTRENVLGLVRHGEEVVFVRGVTGKQIWGVVNESLAWSCQSDTGDRRCPGGADNSTGSGFLHVSNTLRYSWYMHQGQPMLGSIDHRVDNRTGEQWTVLNDTHRYTLATTSSVVTDGAYHCLNDKSRGFSTRGAAWQNTTRLGSVFAAVEGYLRDRSPVGVGAQGSRTRKTDTLQLGALCYQLDDVNCNHFLTTAKSINDKTDGFFDFLLPNTTIVVRHDMVGCVAGYGKVSKALTGLNRSLPSMSAVVGPTCSDDVIDVSRWLGANNKEVAVIAPESTADELGDDTKYAMAPSIVHRSVLGDLQPRCAAWSPSRPRKSRCGGPATKRARV